MSAIAAVSAGSSSAMSAAAGASGITSAPVGATDTGTASIVAPNSAVGMQMSSLIDMAGNAQGANPLAALALALLLQPSNKKDDNDPMKALAMLGMMAMAQQSNGAQFSFSMTASVGDVSASYAASGAGGGSIGMSMNVQG